MICWPELVIGRYSRALEVRRAQDVVISAPGLMPLRVTNDIGQDVCYFFVSLGSSDAWGDDRMGGHEVLGADETRIFFIDPGTIDLMAQDCEGVTVAEQYGIMPRVRRSGHLVRVRSRRSQGGGAGRDARGPTALSEVGIAPSSAT